MAIEELKKHGFAVILTDDRTMPIKELDLWGEQSDIPAKRKKARHE